MNKPHRILACSVAACLFALNAPKLHAQTNGTWTNLNGGSWVDTANWTGGLVANGVGATADFSTLNITANATVTLDGTFTVGTIRFQDATTASNDWILNAGTGGPLTLDVATGPVSIQVLNRVATINAILASGATADPISVTGAGTLALGGANTFTNTLTVGSGMTVSARLNGALGAGGAGNETIVAGGGTLDVQNATANALNFQNEIVQISGLGVGNGGAITNAGTTTQTAALGTVVLNGNSSIGGASRWDIRGATNALNLNGFRLTKVGANTIAMTPGTITEGLIDITAGTVSIEGGATTTKGNGTITVATGGNLGVWATGAGLFTRPIVLAGGSIVEQGQTTTSSTLNAGIVLTASSTINTGSGGGGVAVTLAEELSESGGQFNITKSGSNPLNINAAAKFSGALNVTAGSVVLGAGASLQSKNITLASGTSFNSSAAGGFTLGSGGSLTVGRTGTAANDVLGDLTAAPGSTLIVTAGAAPNTATFGSALSLNATTLQLDIGAAAPDVVAVTGALNVTGTNSITLRPYGTTAITPGPYSLITYGTSSGISPTSFSLANAGDFRQAIALVNPTTTPGSVQVSVTGNNANLIWQGDGTANRWDVNGAANWKSPGPDKFFQLDAVTFDDSSTNGTVDAATDVSPASITVSGTRNYTIGGIGRITSSTGLTKSGTGKLTLANLQNSFVGNITISGGTVSGSTLANAGTASAFGAGSSITLNGGTLEYTGTNLGTSRTIVIGSGTGDGTISVTDPSAVLNLTTALAGTGRLIKQGAGVLRIDTPVTFTGDVVVNAGVLRANSNTALGTKAINVNAGGTFDPNGQTGAGSRPVLNIAGTGAPGQAAIWNSGAAQTNTPLYGTINLTADASVGSNVRYDFNGGTGGVTINTGTFTLTKTGWGESWWAPNTGAIVGPVVVQAGRLGIQSSSNLGTSNAPITVGPGGELSSFSSVTNDKAIVLNGGNFGNNNDATTATWTGGLTVSAPSFIGSNANVVSRIIQLTSPTFSLGGSTLTKVNRLTLNVNGATGGTGPGNLVVLGGQVNFNEGSLINGTGVLAIKSDGTVNLDDSISAVTLSKTTQLDGGLLASAAGSRTIGPVVVSGHGRIANNGFGTILTIPSLTVPADSGVTFINVGDIKLTSLNGTNLTATPFRLPSGYTAGQSANGLLPARWSGTTITTVDTTDNNFTTPTATSIELVNASPTISSDSTVDTVVAEGTMNINNDALLRLAGGTLILRGGANFSVTTSTTATPGRLTSSAPSGDLHVTEGVVFGTAGGDSGIRVRLVDNPSTSGFTPMTLIKQGPGSLVDLGFDGTNGFDNTYTGGTVINNGRIPISSSNALGSGPVTIRDGGQVAFFNSTGVRGNFLSNNFSIAGTGGGENNGPFGAIRLGIANQTFSVIGGNIALTDSARVHNQNTNDGILAGLISGPATATLTKTGGNVVLLSNPANTYLGATETGSRDQLASGAINVMRLANGGQPSSLGASSNAASNVVLQSNGVLRYVGPGDSTDRLFTLGSSFALNAIPTTTIEATGYGSLNFTNPGALAITPGSYRTLVLSAPASTLGIWLNGGLRNNAFAPLLGDPVQGFGQLQKTGAGNWTLTSDQPYNGTTTVTDGVLQLGSGGTTGMVGTGIVTLQNNGDLVVNRTNALTINNPINGNGTFATTDTEVVQVGSGTTTLGGVIDNSSLKVRVESGKLVLGKESTSAVHAAAIQATVNGGILELGGTGGDQLFDGGATGNAATTVFMNGGTFDMNGRSEGLGRIEGGGGAIRNGAAGTTSTITVGTGGVSSFVGIGSTLQNGTGVLALAKTGTGTINILGDNNTFTGGTTVSQGWLMLGNGGTTGSLPGAVTVSQGGALVVNRSNTLTLANAVTGTGDLVQAGTGMTVLNTPLGYQGATVVGLGQLQVNLTGANNVLPSAAGLRLNGGRVTFAGSTGGSSQTIGGEFTVAGGDVSVNGTAGATTLNLPAAWTRTTGGTVNFGTTGTATISTAIANVGGIAGTTTAAYATLNGASWAAQSGTNTLAAFSGFTANSYAAGTHTDVTADFAFAGATTTDTIRFNAAAALDLTLENQSLSLNRGGILVTPAVGANAVTVSGGTLTGANAAGSEVIVHQHNTSQPATISAVVADNGANATALTKAGTGTLVLTGANTYTGGTHINQGVLQVGSGGTTGALGGGVVQNDATLVFNRSDTYTFTNPISGFGTVVKSGTGILNLRGNGSFGGGLVVSQGTVATDGTSALGLRTVTLGDSNTAANNVALFSDFGADIPNNIVVSSSGTGTATVGSSSSGSSVDPAIFSGNVSLNRATTFQSGNTDRTTFTGVISGNPGTLTFTSGRTTFEAENTYTATDHVIQAGATLQIGTGSVAFPRNQIPDTANVVLNGNAIFQLNGDSEIIGQLNSTSTTSLVQAAGSGPTVLTVANGGTFNGAFNGTANGGLTLEATGGTLTLGGTTDNNTGRLLVNGGTMVLAKTSTASVHAAAIDVTVTAGVLRLGGTGGDQIYDGSATSRTLVVIQGGTFDLNGLDEGFSELNGFGGIVTNTSATAATLTLGTNNWSNSGYYGTIQNGTGTLALTKTGTGGLILGGNNTYTGPTTISGGTLQLGNGGPGGSIASPSIVNNAQLVANRSDDFTISGVISGSGRFIQNGSGRTTLSAANTYTGTTTVNAGALLLASGGSLAGGNVTVNGGVLGGVGAIVGSVTLNGGALAPGAGIGTLNTGPLSFINGSTLSIDVGSATADQANVTGAISLIGNLPIVIALTADPVDQTAFTILNSSAGVTGYASGGRFSYLGNSLDEGEQFNVISGGFSQIFSLNYTADGGKDVVLLAVPEPGALASLIGGAGVLVGLRRFRRLV